VIFYAEEPRISTTFMRAYAAYEQPYTNLVRTRGHTAFWTSQEWEVTGGPQIDEWSPLLGLLLEGAKEVFLSDAQMRDGVRQSRTPLFEFADPERGELPYFTCASPDGGPAVRIDVGDKDKYQTVAHSAHVEQIVGQIRERIKQTAQNMGQEPVMAAANRVLTELANLRAQMANGGQWQDADRKRHEERMKQVTAFAALVRKEAFRAVLSDQENELLRSYGL
jgi:hypothetical protein